MRMRSNSGIAARTAQVWGGVVALGLATVFVSALPALASVSDVTFNFNTTCTVSCGLDGADGNTRSFSAGGISVTASGWTRLSNGTPVASFLGQYSGGLGVTNPIDDGVGYNNLHTVDNNGSDDFVEFKFSTAVKPVSVTLTSFGGTDISYNFDSYASSLFQQEGNSSNPLVLSLLNSTYSDTFRLFAQIGEGNDAFKIKSLTVEPVPVPAALPLFATALAGFGVFGRKRHSVAREAA